MNKKTIIIIAIILIIIVLGYEPAHDKKRNG